MHLVQFNCAQGTRCHPLLHMTMIWLHRGLNLCPTELYVDGALRARLQPGPHGVSWNGKLFASWAEAATACVDDVLAVQSGYSAHHALQAAGI